MFILFWVTAVSRGETGVVDMPALERSAYMDVIVRPDAEEMNVMTLRRAHATHVRAAEVDLARLREGDRDLRVVLHLHGELRDMHRLQVRLCEAGDPLLDLQPSSYLLHLEREAREAMALASLDTLRAGEGSLVVVRLLDLDLRHARLKPEEIGTTKEELLAFQQQFE